LGLVTRHEQLLEDHGKLEAKYQKSVEVVGELRERLNEAQRTADESRKLTEKAEAGKQLATTELEAHRRSIPNIVTNSTLKEYKKLRTEGVDVPKELVPVLERAADEVEVDAILEAISARQAQRYSFLPMGPHSRSIREAMADKIPADTGGGGGSATTEDKEAAADAEQIREVTQRQLRR